MSQRGETSGLSRTDEMDRLRARALALDDELEAPTSEYEGIHQSIIDLERDSDSEGNETDDGGLETKYLIVIFSALHCCESA